MRKFWILFAVITGVILFGGMALFAQTASNAVKLQDAVAEDNLEKTAEKRSANWGKFVGAGIAIGLAALGSGIAVGYSASAAIGAVSEKPSLTGVALIFVALAEGICLWGFLIAFMILQG